MRLIRIDGSLFFGAVNTFQETLRRYEETDPLCKHLLIVMQGVNFIDVAGAEALVAMAKRYRARGGGIYLIRPKEQVVELLERGQYMDGIGRENVFFSKTPALKMVHNRLDCDVCKDCALESLRRMRGQQRAGGRRGLRRAGRSARSAPGVAKNGRNPAGRLTREVVKDPLILPLPRKLASASLPL